MNPALADLPEEDAPAVGIVGRSPDIQKITVGRNFPGVADLAVFQGQVLAVPGVDTTRGRCAF
jgi:hypothetical protein